MAGEEETNGSGPSTEVISRAKEMGWAPKEEWRGNPEQWIDADVFVERGETLMPLLKANNRKLTTELQHTRSQLSEAQRIIQANTEAIEELKNFQSTDLRKQVEQQRKEIKTAIAAARKEGNVEEELELLDQLGEATKALAEPEESTKPKKPAVKPAAKPNGTAEPEEKATDHPDWQAWAKDNPWFGTDRRKTALAVGISDELRANPEYNGLTHRAFLDAVSAEVEKTLGGGKPAVSKVEGGVGNGSGGGAAPSSRNGKSYANLPPEAKAACEKQAARLVGEGRAYKTIEDWRKAYAIKYFEE